MHGSSTTPTPNLPADAVVETNAVFERDAIRPILAGSIPDNVLELIMPHVENHERILKVVMDGCTDRELVSDAFMADPLVRNRADRQQVRALVDDMMDATL